MFGNGDGNWVLVIMFRVVHSFSMRDRDLNERFSSSSVRESAGTVDHRSLNHYRFDNESKVDWQDMQVQISPDVSKARLRSMGQGQGCEREDCRRLRGKDSRLERQGWCFEG